MSTRIRTLNFLPEVFQTTTNSQFLAATLDQIVDQPNVKKIQGYVGSKFGYGVNANDYYVTEPTKTRKDYQLDPGVVFTKTNSSTAKDFISYPGILDALKLEGGLTNNNDRLFNSQFYSWDSFTNLDMLINFNQYYWLFNGPPVVTVSFGKVYNETAYTVTNATNGYDIVADTAQTVTGTNPIITLLRGGTYTFQVNQTSEFWIQGTPGVSGTSPSQSNLSTRDVYGVTNNGATNGTITFVVPEANAQSNYVQSNSTTVDLVTMKGWSHINGQTLSSVGSIDGITSLDGLTLMFYNVGEVNGSFWRISYSGDPSNPTLNLTNIGAIPSDTQITALSGTNWISRSFFKNSLGVVEVIPFLTAPLDTLYYQDGTTASKVGIIKIIENNALNVIDIATDIIGKPQYTAPNGVVFTNGLKVKFSGEIVPSTYATGEYYVQGVGAAIELIPTNQLITPEAFTEGIYLPWSDLPYDIGSWDSTANQSTTPDYITIARNSFDKNAWSRSNRWFHIDVINASAEYNSDPNIISDYATVDNKAKRPIIEFYPNLKLFNSGIEGKDAVDFVDTRTTSAFSTVAGKTNYYPDIQVYSDYTATIQGTALVATKSRFASASSAITNAITCDSTANFEVNDVVIFPNTAIGGLTQAVKYYVAEVIDSTHFTVSSSLNGGVVALTTVSVTPPGYEFYWYPQSTGITVPTADITGSLTVGQFISDGYNNILPSGSVIASIVELVPGTTTILVTWTITNNSVFFSTSSNVSIVASDLTTDNYSVFDGARIVFSADSDATVKDKIYVASLSSLTGTSTPVITLTETYDSPVLAEQQLVALRGYYNQGLEFYFDGLVWKESQTKVTVNQPPLFDVFDSNGISFGDSTVYSGTSFVGCKLFAYGIGTGVDDSVLNFPLRYSSVDNIGDISFDVSLNLDTFHYVTGTTPKTVNVKTGYVYDYSSRVDYTRMLGWQTAASPSIQYQVFEFSYDVTTPTLEFTCDVSPLGLGENGEQDTLWPTVKVYINNSIQASSAYTLSYDAVSTTVTLNTAPVANTIIQILVYSEQVSSSAYYQVPINLSNNPFNTDIETTNVGEIRRQYQSIFFNNPDTTGEVFGSNNYRDLGNLVPWGTEIIQNSASLVLPGTFLRNQDHNLFNSLLFNSREYLKFKSLLVSTVNNSDYVQRYTPSALLDDALDQITANKSNAQPFFWSDMLPSKTAQISNTYNFANGMDVTIFPLSRIYDFSSANYYGVLVYQTTTVNGLTVQNQLIVNQDYTISTDSPVLTVTKDLNSGDKITIKEYTQTYGSFVPNTPTKLGLYRAFIPTVILDSEYTNPTYFIRGHDGSYNKLYGDYDPATGILVDFRDQVLLEFESRVYNNLKLSSTIPIEDYEVVPGFFRELEYSADEWLQMYSPSFLNWVGQNRIDYKRQVYNSGNKFTYNYWQSGNKINNESIFQGYWRGIYQYYYDTTTPNVTPWEMIGLTEQPTWWETRYGAAPYTSDNLVLWEDMAQGINWNNGTPFVVPNAVRSGLLEVLPVDSAGNLVSPFVSVVRNYDSKLFQRDWKVGDNAPAEFSYRRSSSYPFDLVRLMAQMYPAKFFNLAVDLDNYKYNYEFNQYLVNDRSHLNIANIEIYGSGTAKTSYINWIVDYEKQIGVDATTNITELLDNLDVRLVYRLAGFSDKTLLKFFVEKESPNNTNASLLIPDESFNVMLYSNQPFDKVVYSGVVVQMVAGGYSVFGNSQTNAYFKTLTPKYDGNYETISVDGLSVKVTTNYDSTEIIVPYGTVFYTVQEVAQFLASYGACLQNQGMVFDSVEYALEINWSQMIAEYLYWTQIGWSIGSLSTFNPSAKIIKIDKDSYVVQPLTLKQTNFILNQNLYPIQNTDLNIVRNATSFSAQALNDGDVISYGQFNISNFEHGIVFDNVTLFNDLIYNLVTGLRQTRIFVRGSKSAEWNGTVDAQGFIYNQDNIQEWNSQAKYTKGEIVKYKNKYWSSLSIVQPSAKFDESKWIITTYNEIQKGLLPNSSTNSYESTLYYDINKTNLENDADLLSFSLIGFRPRDYMTLADLTDITQVNVYRNMIKDKGTLNAVSAFKGATLPQGGINYDLYENWAIKSADFGGVLNNNFIQFKLNEKYMTGNPSIVGLTDGASIAGVQQEVPLNLLFNYGRPITSVDVLPTVSSIEPSDVYPSAGYVNFNDVKMSSYFYTQLPTAVDKNGVTVPISKFYVRDYVWLANYLENWDVLTTKSIGQIVSVQNNLNNTVTVKFAKPHNLAQYQPFAIVNFNASVNGYYTANIIVDQYNVMINLTLPNQITILNGLGVGLQFESQRVDTASDIQSLPLIETEFIKNTVWVDRDENGEWAVYRKNVNYNLSQALTATGATSFGDSVATATDLGYLIGSATDGVVRRYTYDIASQTYTLLQTITEGTSFGTSIAHAKDSYVISEPTGNKKVHIYDLDTSVAVNALVVHQTALSAPTHSSNWGYALALSGDTNWLYVANEYEAVSCGSSNLVVDESYTITVLGDTDWNSIGYVGTPVVGGVFVASATSDPTSTGYATRVSDIHVFRKSQLTSDYEKVNVIVNATLPNTAKFGQSISTDYYGSTIVVGAPNQNYNSTTSEWGYSYVYQRAAQNIEVYQNTIGTFKQQFPLAWTVPTVSNAVVSTSTVGHKITFSAVTGFAVNDAIIFPDTTMMGSNVMPNTVYYISSISGLDITIKASRTASTDIQVETNTGTESMVGYVQTTEVFVYLNGTLVTDNNYAFVGDSLIYTTSLTAGDIITVSGQEIALAQTLTTEATPRVGVRFGNSVTNNTHASELLVGAPFELSTGLDEGAVFRFTSNGSKYGQVVGNSTVNVTAPRDILINGFLVEIPIGSVDNAVDAIVLAHVPNVTASASDGILTIQLVDNNLSPSNQKLVISTLDQNAFSELGISLYTLTQNIECPRMSSTTGFGTTVKFNEYNSFVVSAPTSVRYENTTFDFSDDENQDDDTLFDNNATTWIDNYENAGAVYMFDYLPTYNESISNTGKFIFAQSINSHSEVYGNQPNYGSALDFNEFKVIVGSPTFTDSVVNGEVVVYNNTTATQDWSVYRQSAPVVDINRIYNIQLFSAETNNTLMNLDYIDPLQGKILGAARENIDVVASIDPALYNKSNIPNGRVWGAEHVGKIWFDTSNVRFVNYHQDDVVYNSKYWGTVFPNSDVAVYSWIASTVLPSEYIGPGTPYSITSYATQVIINASGALTPIYYYWVRDTNLIFTKSGKTLSDTVIASYIQNAKNSGVSYFAPLLPSTYALYNSINYINATDTVLSISYSTGTNDDPEHNQYSLIRANFETDFLPGIPQEISGTPISLYNKLLASLSGVDDSGAVVPDPFLPKAVQSGIQTRPRQSFFYNRLLAIQNYLEFANEVLAQYPIVELRRSSFLNSSGTFYDTADYWNYINWWATGYSDSTKSTVQVAIYADLATLTVPVGTIASVLTNNNGSSETYVLSTSGTWTRIGLTNGTIEFKKSLWNYSNARTGFGDNFFDTSSYDQYPSEETRKIVRAINEELFIEDLLLFRNKGLILLFEYIQSETSESQNFLPWLNKTSLVDVTHTIRELLPVQVFKSDNQDFLAGYINEVKPYHVVIKDFLFRYTGTEVFESTVTDFDLPAEYNSSVDQFITPQLVYSQQSGDNQYLPSSSIWQQTEYTDWFNNYGVSLSDQPNTEVAVLTSYIALNSSEFSVNDVSGLPVYGTITIGEEQIAYSAIDRELNVVSQLTRGVNGTTITVHYPDDTIFMDLPAVLVLNSGKNYTAPPKVVAYIDTSIYPEPKVAAVLVPQMNLDKVVGVTVVDPGLGYAVTPEIKIEAAESAEFTTTQVSAYYSTINVFAPYLTTGDLVQYRIGVGSTAITGLVENGWYYVNVVELTPTTVVELYTNYSDALAQINKVEFFDTGSGTQSLNLGARAVGLTTASPVRENNIAIKFDRTTYNSQISDWVSGEFYGSPYSGTQVDMSSSSIHLESTMPPIDSISAGTAGVLFDIVSVTNDQNIEYSGLSRNIISTAATTNIVTLDPAFTGPVDSGTTVGFYVGMPVKFSGENVGGILTNVVYYIAEVVSSTEFKLSEDSSGSPVKTLTSGTTASTSFVVGEITNTAVLTTNYPGIYPATATSTSNVVTVPLSSMGSLGTTKFYSGLPVFFTGTTFGGIIENQVYYVSALQGLEGFTLSESETTANWVVTSTSSSTNAITVSSTGSLTVGQPIIFNQMSILGEAVDAFGGITYGVTYYVYAITSSTEVQLSATRFGPLLTLTTQAAGTGTSMTMFDQTNVVQLSNATGSSMFINVGLPLSPGQLNGKKFNFYETSATYSPVSGLTTTVFQTEIAATSIWLYAISFNSNNIFPEIYVNMPFKVSTNIGGLVAGTQYYVVKAELNQLVAITTYVGSLVQTQDPGVLYPGMPITFGSGTAFGGLNVNQLYYVDTVIDSTLFSITDVNGNPVTTVNATGGSMVSTGRQYIQAATTLGGSPVAVTEHTVTGTETVLLQQTPTATPTFHVNYVAGSYSVGTVSSGSGFTTGNQILIYGTDLGGSSPSNDLTLTVTDVSVTTTAVSTDLSTDVITVYDTTGLAVNDAIVFTFTDASFGGLVSGTTYYVKSVPSSTTLTVSATYGGSTFNITTSDMASNCSATSITGRITGVLSSGNPNGSSASYYLKVNSANSFKVYSNPQMTLPVSGISFPYSSITTSTVSATNVSGNISVADASLFAVNDQVVFTGDVVGGIQLAHTYFVTYVNTGTNVIKVSETFGGTAITLTTATSTFTVAKYGSFMLLPEPFENTQSIVKFNNRIYACVISNNDSEFIIGKWELVTAGDRRLNALDRIIGYYQPTNDMPGVDLTQLVDGIEYPNSTYLGNPFNPTYQNTLDTELTNITFTGGNVDLQSILWNGSSYVCMYNADLSSGTIIGNAVATFNTAPLAKSNLSITDATLANGVYVATTQNSVVPILVGNGNTWSAPDQRNLVLMQTSLEAVANFSNVFVGVGKTVVTSSDNGSTWTERVASTSNAYVTNTLFDVSGANIGTFSGFVAVGSGQQVANLTVSNVSYTMSSSNGISWTVSPVVTPKGFYGIADNGSMFVAVGEDGVVYYTQNGYNWIGCNETQVISTIGVVDLTPVDQIILTSVVGLAVNDTIRFTSNVDVLSSSVTYYIVSITGNNIQVSLTPSGPVVSLSGVIPTINTYAYIYPRTASLRDVAYANGIFVAVGDSGLIRTSTTGYTWVTRTTTATENLNSVTYNSTDNKWIAVGNNNVVVESTDAITWTTSTVVVNNQYVYQVKGNDFEYGYGPEELVPGIVTDNIMMTVTTRPGTNWDSTVFAHVGYGVSSIELTPTYGTQTRFSFSGVAQTAAQIAVFVINGTSGVAIRVYEPFFTVDWVNKEVILATPLTFTPVADKLMIEVYEVGNGFQLVKSSTDNDPIRTDTSGFNEVYVNANYDDELTNTVTGAFWTDPVVYHNGTQLVLGALGVVTNANGSTNQLTCGDTSALAVNMPITFSASIFGGLSPFVTYYVKTISGNLITVSTTVGGSTVVLVNGTGGASYITNGYAITMQGNNPRAKIMFATNAYAQTTDYLAYSLLGQTTPQYGFTIPETQVITTDGSTVYTLTNYIGGTNPVNAIVENNGLRMSSGYTIDPILNTITFTSAPTGVIAVTSFTSAAVSDRQYFNTTYGITGKTVFKIQYIDNTINATYPAVRVTTSTTNSFALNDLVIIDGVLGSTELNNNQYYVRVLTTTTFELYTQPYDSSFGATNYPVTNASTYLGGGYVWPVGTFTLKTTTASATTTTTNVITVASTAYLVENTPVYFTASGTAIGADVIGGLIAGSTYYVNHIVSPTTFTVSNIRGGANVALTTDTGTVNVTQWEQDNVDRLWVTVNGYRVPPSSLRINPYNELSILAEIGSTDKVTIMSMMPSATPNEEVYLLNVDKSEVPTVYRTSPSTKTWLTQDLAITDTIIHVSDVSRVVNVSTQTSVVGSAVSSYYYIPLEADKRILTGLTVYNGSTLILDSYYSVVIQDASPVLKLSTSSGVLSGDTVTITIIQGNMIYINGEQIKFGAVDFNADTISGLQRGFNGTGVMPLNATYSTVYGMLPENTLNSGLYDDSWNSYVYGEIPATYTEVDTQYVISEVGDTDFTLIGARSNTVGVRFVATGVGTGTGRVTLVSNNDPLQISSTASAIFLKQ